MQAVVVRLSNVGQIAIRHLRRLLVSLVAGSRLGLPDFSTSGRHIFLAEEKYKVDLICDSSYIKLKRCRPAGRMIDRSLNKKITRENGEGT